MAVGLQEQSIYIDEKKTRKKEAPQGPAFYSQEGLSEHTRRYQIDQSDLCCDHLTQLDAKADLIKGERSIHAARQRITRRSFLKKRSEPKEAVQAGRRSSD